LIFSIADCRLPIANWIPAIPLLVPKHNQASPTPTSNWQLEIGNRQ